MDFFNKGALNIIEGGIMIKLRFMVTAFFFITFAGTVFSDENMILIQGGTFRNTNSNYYNTGTTVSDFWIGKYEVTQAEWEAVMGNNPSSFRGNNYPVMFLNWYDCIEYCNRRSELEGLTPVYNIDKTQHDTNNTNILDYINWTVTANWSANGYRLPTEAEWEYAASGGQLSQNYMYSGSDNAADVAWNTENLNNDMFHQVGSKKPNELGLYDMTGNVAEWCWDWYGISGESGEISVDIGMNPKGNSCGAYRVVRDLSEISLPSFDNEEDGDSYTDHMIYQGFAAQRDVGANDSWLNLGFRVVRSVENRRLFGSVEVSVQSAGKLYIDGTFAGDLRQGSTTVLRNIVPVGTPRLEIRYEGGTNREEKHVSVVEGAMVRVNFEFMNFETRQSGSMVFVEGGAFRNTHSNYFNNGTILSDFWISKFEVTQEDWQQVMGDRRMIHRGPNLPVTVSWYDCIEYCNRRSELEGVTPVYNIDKTRQDPNNSNRNDRVKWIVTVNRFANGYRLPTEAEWEYAASGGQLSRSYLFSGSNTLNYVAWCSGTGGGPRPVGTRQGNELGLYDMTGNVAEWCWDWLSGNVGTGQNPKGTDTGGYRVVRGKAFSGFYNDYLLIKRDGCPPNVDLLITGFRVVRSNLQ